MGFFSDARDVSLPEDEPLAPTPLTLKRIEHVLDHLGLSYEVDDAGEIALLCNWHLFLIVCSGEDKEILCVEGRLRTPLPRDQEEEGELIIEDWHRGYKWPSCALVPVLGETVLSFSGYHAIDYEYGATDAQIESHINCAISAITLFLNHAAKVMGLKIENDDEE